MAITLIDKVWTKSDISIPNESEFKVTLRQLISDLVRESHSEYDLEEGSLARRLLGVIDKDSPRTWLRTDNPLLKLKIDTALKAVTAGKVFAFVGDDQVDDIDAPLKITPGVKIEFFSITPVQGG